MSEFSRECTECGKLHDTGVQNMQTGEMLSRIDKCYDCFMKTAYTYVPIEGQITLLENLNEILGKYAN